MLDLKQRINCFQLILYKDSETLNYDKIMNIIKSSEFYSCKYYCCLHNNDINDNGEIKKAHYHLVVKLDNSISIDNIIKSLDNEPNIQNAIVNNFSIVKSLKGAIQYLIHKNNKDKYHYDINDIISNDNELLLYFKEENTLNDFEKIINVITDLKIHSLKDLIIYAINNNDVLLLDYIKSNTYLVNSIIRG